MKFSFSSLFFYVLLTSCPILFSSCTGSATIDGPLPRLTHVNAKSYKVSGNCSSGLKVSITYRIDDSDKEQYVDFFNCNNGRWSKNIDFSKVNLKNTKKIILVVGSVSKFSPTFPEEGTIEVVSQSLKAFIDDSALIKKLGHLNFQELVISGGCAEEGDELSLLIEGETMDQVRCEESLWQSTLNLMAFFPLEKDQMEIVIQHQNSDGLITEDLYQLPLDSDSEDTVENENS